LSGGLYKHPSISWRRSWQLPLAKRFGLGSVLGFLLAGVVIRPFVMRMHFAEFGVVMMLFLIALELCPALLWRMPQTYPRDGRTAGRRHSDRARHRGGPMWKPALDVGLILAMSSTAVVPQSLGEKGVLKTPGCEASFAVLLFQNQDIAARALQSDVEMKRGRSPENDSPS
jgi:monovalent cation:H+ antiporter-2, CPA2 family